MGSPFEIASAIVFANIGVHPIFIGGKKVGSHLFGFSGFKDGLALVGLAIFGPVLAAQFFEDIEIPSHGVRSPGFGLDIVPKHILLAFATGPGGFAGQRAGLASNTFVQVEDNRPLFLRAALLVGILHLAVDLPIFNV